MHISRLAALASSLLVCAGSTSQTAPTNRAATPIHLEAENAQFTGPRVETKRDGFSGRGYLSSFDKAARN